MGNALKLVRDTEGDLRNQPMDLLQILLTMAYEMGRAPAELDGAIQAREHENYEEAYLDRDEARTEAVAHISRLAYELGWRVDTTYDEKFRLIKMKPTDVMCAPCA